MSSTPPLEIPCVVRICVEQYVFFAPPWALREEVDSLLYRGFGRWNAETHRPVELERLMAVQRDLRLWIALPEPLGLRCCDLSRDPIDADPFDLLPEPRCESLPWPEFLPETQTRVEVPNPRLLELQRLGHREEILFEAEEPHPGSA